MMEIKYVPEFLALYNGNILTLHKQSLGLAGLTCHSKIGQNLGFVFVFSTLHSDSTSTRLSFQTNSERGFLRTVALGRSKRTRRNSRIRNRS